MGLKSHPNTGGFSETEIRCFTDGDCDAYLNGGTDGELEGMSQAEKIELILELEYNSQK